MIDSLGKLGWYINRLRAMSVPELGHRLREAARRRASAMHTYDFSRFGTKAADLPQLLVDIDLLGLLDADTVDVWRSVAPPRETPGIYRALGHGFRLSKDMDWHLDPVSGLRWPDDIYCFGIDYRHDRKRGDVKLVWELNRLQFVPIIAALARLEDDDELAECALDLIESWIDANPPFKGINWISGIELALRVVSILLTIALVGCDRIGDRLSRKIGACLAAHAYWLTRFPSRYSSANNHLIAEEAALFLLGTLWPNRGIAADASAARDVLIAEVFRQIHADGVGAEQSPTYTSFTCEWYLLVFAVAKAADAPFPDSSIARIEAAGEHMRWLLDGAGHHPRIGDDDEGRVIASGAGHEPFYVASIVNGIGVLTGNQALGPPIAVLQLRNLVTGWRREKSPPLTGVRAFEQGGYTISRGRISGHDSLAVLDHGPLGYLSIAAHGHADALSLMLHLDDRPVLVDAGTYLYHAGGSVRDRLRGTAAHNTLCIDSADQSEISGAFNWRRKADSTLSGLEVNSGVTRVTAQHDGYIRDHGIVCERAVTIDATGLSVLDRLLSTVDDAQPLKSIRIGFLLHPDCSATVDGAIVTVTRDGCALMQLSVERGMVAVLEAAEYSPAFGVMEHATRIVFHATDLKAREFRTRIAVLPAIVKNGSSPALQPDIAPVSTMAEAGQK